MTARVDFYIFFILQLYSSYKLPPWDHNLHWQQLGKSSLCSHIHNRVLSHKLMKFWSLNFEILSVAFWGLMASKAAEWVGSISQTQCWPPGLHCLQGANHPPHILTNHQLLYYNIRQQKRKKRKISITALNWHISKLFLSSPRAKRAGLKGLRAESARAVTGRRYPHSGKGEDFLTGQPDFFTKTAVAPEQKVEKSIRRW